MRAAEPAPLELPSDKPVLLVVHPAYEPEADIDGTARDGVNETIRIFKAKGWPVVYILSCKRGRNYVEDGRPTATICSSNGFHSIQARHPDVFLAGGQYNGCLNRAVKAIAAGAGFPFVFADGDLSLTGEERKQLVSLSERTHGAAPVRLTLHHVLDALYVSSPPDFSQSLKSAPVESLLYIDPQGGMPLGAGFTMSGPPIWKTVDADVDLLQEDGASVALAKAGKPSPRKLTLRFVTLDALKAGAGSPPIGSAGTRRKVAVPSALELLKSFH